MAAILRDFEPQVAQVTLRAYDDGRLNVFSDGRPVYVTAEHNHRLPDYETDILPVLKAGGT